MFGFPLMFRGIGGLNLLIGIAAAQLRKICGKHLTQRHLN